MVNHIIQDRQLFGLQIPHRILLLVLSHQNRGYRKDLGHHLDHSLQCYVDVEVFH